MKLLKWDISAPDSLFHVTSYLQEWLDILQQHQKCRGTPVWVIQLPMPTSLVMRLFPDIRRLMPMVYCGLYPADGAKYQDLRDALEKLQLNDAALQFEAETSIALGFGFRCGFLGLLHLEVIQERLEREYNLDLVTTAPGVVYQVYKTDGEMIELTNPSNLPDPSEIEYMEEPMVKAEIMVTNGLCGSHYAALARRDEESISAWSIWRRPEQCLSMIFR